MAVHEVDLRQVVRLARVSCWHMGEFESEAMWRLYARERDGIAIKTVFARFKDAFWATKRSSHRWCSTETTEPPAFRTAMLCSRCCTRG